MPSNRTTQGYVYRPVVTETRNGRKRKRRTRYYWAYYTDGTGNAVRHVLRAANGQRITDKEVAEAQLRSLVKRSERETAGLVDPFIESASLPLCEVIDRYAEHLRGLRRTPLHVQKSTTRIRWLAETGGIAKLGELDAARVASGLNVLAGMGRSPKTINDYRAAIFGMCRWAVEIARILEKNPVQTVRPRARGGEVRKRRRALTPEEAGRLLAVAGRRELWYEMALFTGLRVDELRQLTWGDLVLAETGSAIRLRPETTKARREDVLPLKAALAKKLVLRRPPTATDACKVFRTTPSLETFRTDCERAGIQWRADSRGRTLDRHALRTTFITWLSMSGIDPRTAQELARHTDIALTMQNYTDPRLLGLQAAVEKLPNVRVGSTPSRRASAAGTTEASEPVVVPVVVESDFQGHSVARSPPRRPKKKCNECHNMARKSTE